MSSSEPSEFEHRAEVVLRAGVQDFVGDESGVVGRLNLLEIGIDKTCQTGLQGHFDGRVDIGGIAVRIDHIAQCACVVHDGAVHAPLVLQDRADEVVGDAGHAVVGVVGRHQRLGSRAGAFPETVRIIVAEERLVEAGVGAEAAVFVAVREEVLHQRRAAPVLRIVALDAAHFGGHQLTHEIGVFAKTLLRAAPARVAGEIGVGRPEHEGFERGAIGIETGFIGHHVTYDAGHLPVPGLTDAVGLRKGRAVAVLGRRPARPAEGRAGVQGGQFAVAAAHDAVDGLGGTGPRDAEARDTLAHDRGDLLIDGHQGHGVVKTFVLGEGGILERIGKSLGAERAGWAGPYKDRP